MNHLNKRRIAELKPGDLVDIEFNTGVSNGNKVAMEVVHVSYMVLVCKNLDTNVEVKYDISPRKELIAGVFSLSSGGNIKIHKK